ncbi:MFS transporter [Nonomuraea aurantiaca]|uniref:MFS transporter n=1 Tax=Nonomuraea aurantiaca TaxID=2878562 RepID=UPI001CD99A3C|nr:MFS transporter [Nonomuraea aurantiaca]MCA2221848.1 MFS transporter [Nonomuraea aurantiaca]
MTDSTEGEPSIRRPDSVWQRDFNLLWSGSAISQIGLMNATMAAPLLALSLSGSPVFAGWVTAAATLPRLLLHLPVGALVDRSDRRRVMIVSLVARAVLAALLTASVLVFGGWPALLVAAVAAQGVCAVFYSTAETTAVPRLVPSVHRPRAMGRNEARIHAAGLLGRPLGGLLFDAFRWLPFAADMLASLVSVLAVFRMDKNRLKPPMADTPLRFAQLAGELWEGLAFLRKDGFLPHVVFVCTLANFLFQTLALVLVLVLHQLRLSSLMIGCVVAATGLGGVLGSFTAPWLLRRLLPERAIVMCVWAWLALSVLLAVTDHTSAFYVAFLLPLAWGGIGFMGAHINVAVSLYQAEHVPEHMLGTVTGVSRFFSGGAVPLGGLASGYVVAGLGTQGAAIIVAVLVGALAWVMAWGRCRRSAPAGSPEDPPRPSPPRPSGSLQTVHN